MRVFPLFKQWALKKKQLEHLKSVEDAIALVSRFASGAQAFSRETAANAATNVRNAGADCDVVAAKSAAGAAEAAAEAADMPRNDASVKPGNVTAASSCAARSAQEAVRATKSVYNGNTCAADEAVAACVDAARSDFKKLADSKQTTVDVTESGDLGQLWPTGQPDWFLS